MNANLNYLISGFNYLLKLQAFQKPSTLIIVLRIVMWGIHFALKMPTTIKLKNDIQFYLPYGKRIGATGIYILREDYEPEVNYLKNVLSPGKVFVDAGASFGIYTVIASKLVGDSGKVLAFEPAIETYPILERNVITNKMKNVKTFQAALSDESGTAKLYHINNAPRSFSLAKDGEETSFEKVSTVTLESVFKNEVIERFDLMKMDVEGAEELILRSSKSLIMKWQPQIIFEFGTTNGANRLGLKQDGAWNLLKEWGYEFFGIEMNSEKLKRLTSPRLGNIIAISISSNQLSI